MASCRTEKYYRSRLRLCSETTEPIKFSSSMTVLDGPPLIDGLVVVPDTQTAGQGRSANAWISPRGCAMFSLQLHLGAESNLGKRPTLIQHLVGLAVCRALRWGLY